jgi:hypothetical protein
LKRVAHRQNRGNRHQRAKDVEGLQNRSPLKVAANYGVVRTAAVADDQLLQN